MKITKPTTYEVDEALLAIEAEDARQKEALRRFYERERPGLFLTWQQAAGFFGKCLFWFLVTWLLIAGALAL